MKANRAQYRRNWAAANRTLRNANVAMPLNHEDDDLFELSPDTSPLRSSDNESDLEQDEPSPKCARTSPHPAGKTTLKQRRNDVRG